MELQSLTEVAQEVDNVEICVSETYELMDVRSFVRAAVLFLACHALIVVLILISPQAKFKSWKITEVSSKTVELTLALRYTGLKFYHRHVKFGLESMQQSGKTMSILVSGTVKLMKGPICVKPLVIENSQYALLKTKTVEIFQTYNYEITDIIADLDISAIEGEFNYMTLVWSHDNPSWLFFAILARCIMFLVSLFVFLKLFSQITLLKKKFPTYLHRYILISSFILMVLWLPIPELRYFDILTEFSPILDLYDRLCYVYMFYFITIVCYSMVFKFTADEVPFFKRSAFVCLIVAVVVSLPAAIKFYDPFYQDILELSIPIAFMIVATINLLRFPLQLEPQSSEFSSSFFHLGFSLPCMVLMIFAISTKTERNSKFGVGLSLMNALCFIFLVLLHWPRDEEQEVEYEAPVAVDGSDFELQGTDDAE